MRRGVRILTATTASDELSPELALGNGGGSGLEGVGDCVKVRLQLLSSIILLRKGGVVGVESGSSVY